MRDRKSGAPLFSVLVCSVFLSFRLSTKGQLGEHDDVIRCGTSERPKRGMLTEKRVQSLFPKLGYLVGKVRFRQDVYCDGRNDVLYSRKCLTRYCSLISRRH